MNLKNIFRKIRKYKNWQEVLLWSIFLLGMIYRIIFASNTQLWRDEVYMFFVSRDYGFKDLLLLNHWDTLHPPLYTIFLHYWQIISINPLFLRIPSLIASAISLWMIVQLAKRYFGKYKYMSIISLLFFAVSQPQISLATLVRPYSFTILAVLISLYLFKEVLETGKHWFLFGLVNFFVFFADYSGVWLLVTYLFFILYELIKNRRVMKKEIVGLIKSTTVLLLLLIFYIPIFLKGLNNSLRIERSVLSDLFGNENSMWEIFRFAHPFFAGITKSDILVQLGIDYYQLSVLVLIIALFGLVVIGEKAKRYSKLFVFLMVLSPLISFLVSMTLSPIYLSRNLHVVTIAVVFGLSLATSYLLKKNIRLGLFVVIFLLANFFQNPIKIQYVDPKIDWRQATDYIHSNYDKQSAIIFTGPKYVYKPLEYYYLLAHKTPMPKMIAPRGLVNNLHYNKALLVRVNIYEVPFNDLKIFFDNNDCRIDKIKKFDNIQIYHCVLY